VTIQTVDWLSLKVPGRIRISESSEKPAPLRPRTVAAILWPSEIRRTYGIGDPIFGGFDTSQTYLDK
jgi:hypothetical protein